MFVILLLDLRGPGVPVRMVDHGPLPVGLLDLLLVGVLVDRQDLVVVLPLGLLQLELGFLQQLPGGKKANLAATGRLQDRGRQKGR